MPIKTQLLEQVLQEDLTPFTLIELIEEVFERLPDKIAVKFQDQSLTFREINQRGNQIGHAILERLSAHQKVVAGLCGLNPDMYLLTLGIHKARGILVGLPADGPENVWLELLEDSQAELLVCDQANQGTAQRLGEITGLDVICIEDVHQYPITNLGLDYQPEDHLVIPFTSGSTGKSKGVVLSNSTILYSLSINANIISMDDRLLSFSHFNYGNGQIAAYKAWLFGAASFPFDLKKNGLQAMISMMKQEEITLYHSVPTLFRSFVRTLQPGELSALRWIHLGGEPLYARDVQLFLEKFGPETTLFNNLGSMEAPSICRYFVDRNADWSNGIVPVGKPFKQYTVTLIDEAGNPAEPGQTGEIVVQSRYLATKYWNDPELTAASFLKVEGSDEAIYHMGDFGMVRPDGNMIYMGRKDNQVKVHGNRVELWDIESKLVNILEVREAVVKDVRSPSGLVRLVGYVVLEEGADITETEIRQNLSAEMLAFMVPTRIIILEDFPKTATGKTVRTGLPAVDLTIRPEDGRSYVAPQNETEKTLVRAWEEILGISSIGVQDDFFELGGDSLQAMRLFVVIEEAIGEKMPLAMLLQAPNIRAQAKLIEQKNWSKEWSSLVTLREGGDEPPLFFMAPVGGNVLSYRDLVSHLEPNRPCYALQSVGLDGIQQPFTDVDIIAEYYIQEIKKKFPTGPYYLCGSSFGGKVAYVMAQQMADQGDEVGMVIMFDTSAMRYRHQRKPGITRRKKRFLKLIGNLQKHLSNLRLVPWRGKIGYGAYQVGGLYRRLKRGLREKYLARRYPIPEELKRTERANRWAKFELTPPRFEGHLVLFRASQQPTTITPDPTLGWGLIAGEKIEIIEMPGNHTTLIYEPRAGSLAGRIDGLLGGE